ncbi:hypothetical protein K458DRAFT_296503 [Lentithecium fluviatile CBS 122367]|uniref:polynucleotide adenylyltransferase n=1 Tax=Lentithecium fluviatile CBS 122367 TaxID=1168545 RepID=A0A6G1JAB1_9PLEO|nr:hypothetical protein K458DRAFT_296503 [Lentithecium fluviatile CBS 122367]
MGDTYRPSRPARDHPPPPLTDRTTFSTSGGGSSYRSSGRQHGGRNANNSEFTFSSDHHAPQFPPTGPANSERGARRQRGRGGRDGRRRGDFVPSHAASRNNANGFRRGGFKKAPHERALLQIRDDTIEHVLGVPTGPNKFRDVEDVSDDEESATDYDPNKSDGDSAGSGKHKIARKQSSTAADGNSVPKWSNPDPYTVLPPPEETTGKRIDVVKLIRKAKNEAAEKADALNAVAANDDFISFGDDDDDHAAGSDDEEPPPAPWNRSSVGSQPLAGSLNDVIVSGALSAPNRNTKRSAATAGLPERPQQRGRAQKRRRNDALDIVEEWQSQPGQHPAPWAIERRNEHLLRKPEQWLHNEIMDFYDAVVPLKHEHELRLRLVDRIQAVIGERAFPECKSRLHCFGSFPAGLYLPTADLDLVYASDQHFAGGPARIFTKKNDLYKIAKKLSDKGIAANTKVIHAAKVPIIKFTDKVTGIPVDISFENLGGVRAQEHFKKWQVDYPDMVYIVALIKQFLVMRGVNEVNTGGLGGFSTICLVVSYLQLGQKPNNLSELLLGFLDYYGNHFDLDRQRIIMNPPSRATKGAVGIDGRNERPFTLSIQDPNLSSNNISGGSFRVREIFHAFSEAYNELTKRMEAIRHGAVTSNSILEAILGGNYDAYEDHRAHMRTQAMNLK